MAVVSLDGLSFSALVWTFKLLPSKHTETSICHLRPFAGTFLETGIWSQRAIKINENYIHVYIVKFQIS